MTETRDESALVSMLCPSSASTQVEVMLEMLDYAFVDKCQERDELRAVLDALVAGAHGCYPELEECVRDKLASLSRPGCDTPSASTESLEATDAHHRNALGDWLELPRDAGGLPMARVRADLPPVRTMLATKGGKGGVDVLSRPSDGQGPSTSVVRSTANVFRKEKLSTKEYYESWAKFDAELSEEDDDDDAKAPATRARSRAPLEDRVESATKRIGAPPLPSAVDQQRAKGRARASTNNKSGKENVR